MLLLTSVVSWDSIEAVKQIHSRITNVSEVFWGFLLLFEFAAMFWKRRALNIIGIVCFAIAILGEHYANKYGDRQEELHVSHEASIVREFNEKLETAKKITTSTIDEHVDVLKKQEESLRNSSDSLDITASRQFAQLEHERQHLEAQGEAIEVQRQSVEELAKRTERRDRILTDKQANELIIKLRVYSGKQFWIVTETNDYDLNSEQMRFSTQLATILTLAGWLKNEKTTLNQPSRSLPVYKPVTDSGIQIYYSAIDPHGEEMANSVIAALAAYHVDSHPGIFTDSISDTLIFYIGLR